MNKETLTKSIDALIDELFAEPVEKSIDIVGDAPKTADEALAAVPGSEDDAARGAGRPKQISDVPKTDEDGSRDGQYDAKIASAQGEEEPEETKQSPSIDQVEDGKGRIAQSPKAPASAPFKKSFELTEAEYAEFQALKKSQAKAEELKKAEQDKKERETLIKSAVTEATSTIRKDYAELQKSFAEAQALLKSIAGQPRQSKSITGIEALEKSQSPESKSGPETFSKSEILDAAVELAKSGKISDLVVSEIEMTGRVYDTSARRTIETFLATGK